MTRQGWRVGEAPPLDLRPWKNPATGKIEMVPRGIDPSFAYNPGQAWKEKRLNMAKVSSPLSPRPSVHLAPSAAKEQQAKDIGKLFLPNASGQVNAGTLPSALKEGLETGADHIILSDDTLKKNLKHRELTKDDYKALPSMLSDPLLAVRDSQYTAFLVSHWAGKLYRLVIKRTKSGKAIFLETFSRTNPKRALGQIKTKKSPIIAGSLEALKDFIKENKQRGDGA